MDTTFRVLLILMLVAIWWQTKQVHALVNAKYTALQAELRDAKVIIAELTKVLPRGDPP